MKKVIFTIEGRRFEIELEKDFADFVEANLEEQKIFQDRNNEALEFIKAYLNILKENYEAVKQIKTILNKMNN
jgi:hypothetical protein